MAKRKKRNRGGGVPFNPDVDTGTKRPVTARVAVGDVNDKFSDYPSNGLTPRRLARIFREADEGNVRAQMELFEEMEEKDTHLFSQMQTRKLAVTGLDWEVQPFSEDEIDKEIADFIDEQLKGIENFDEVLIDMLDAIGKGISIMELAWTVELKELARTIVNGCFIKHAEGDWLKIKAADYSKQQKEAKAARGYVSIYRSEYNNALQVTKGHCFKTEPDAGGNELKFYCCENTVIDAGEPVGRVLVEAEATGTYYNIAPGRITISMIHLDGVDYVTNEDDWLFEEGAEEEDLEDLRDRCMSSWAELATRTIEEKLRNAAKAVPGVLDARIDAQHPRGQGTVDVIVTGAAGEASPELIRKVGEAIEPLKGNYEDYLVKSSEVVRQDFELVIYLAEDAATDGVDAQATKLIEDMMALTRGEMNTLYRDSIIQVLSTKIDNYRKTDILQPSDDMVLEQDKVIMAGDINVTVRNVVQSARGKE